MAAYPPYQAYPGPAPALITPPPILVAAADPAPQQRLTVFFRFILLLPHLIVLCLMGIAALVVAFIGWWGALFTARLPLFAVNFLSGCLRWWTRVYAYAFLLTDVYPPFTPDDGPNLPGAGGDPRAAAAEPRRRLLPRLPPHPGQHPLHGSLLRGRHHGPHRVAGHARHRAAARLVPPGVRRGPPVPDPVLRLLGDADDRLPERALRRQAGNGGVGGRARARLRSARRRATARPAATVPLEGTSPAGTTPPAATTSLAGTARGRPPSQARGCSR